MKKRLCALLSALAVLALLLPASGEGFAYMSDFAKEFDGWTARSAGGAQLALDNGALGITGRGSDWNSPGRDFPLAPGTAYDISVMVRQDERETATFMISVAHTEGGKESYENLARSDAGKGVWTRLEGSYIAGSYERFVLYVETLGAPKLDFHIKEFSVKARVKGFDADLLGLKDLYAGYFDFGCAVTRVEALSKDRMDFYASQFNIMTPGNELKPDSVLDLAASRRLAATDETAVAVHIDAAKPLLDYAWEHGVKVHGHVLLWHNQTPDAFFREGYSMSGPFVTRETMLARLDNYIRLVFELTQSRYPGLIVSCDVVNEAVDDGTGAMRASLWTRVVGTDFVREAFRIARKHAPEGVALYYNDYSTPYEPKLTGILRLLGELTADGAIDGYGFQCHYQLDTPSLRQLQNAMDKVIALGLTLRVSELDILVNAATEEAFALQAKRYGSLLELFRSNKDHIAAVQTWGVTDDLSWKANHYPLLFDKDGQPKPAFFAIADPVR